jgi:hypothetical protein
MAEWPEWWNWELELSPHALKRMADRDFTELELRRMLDVASDLQPDLLPERWRVVTRLRRRPWEVIVEPDTNTQRLVIITAYSLGS